MSRVGSAQGEETTLSNFKTDSMYRAEQQKQQRSLKATNSCTKIIRTQAGIFAISHPHKKTGYKEPMSETNARTLGGLTTYKQFYELGVELPTVQKKQARGVNYKTKLGPYNPIATCNRLPVKFENEPVPFARFCAPRNVSQFDIGAKTYERRFLTHNHAFYPTWQAMPVGFENAGVMSDFASRIHVAQER